MPKEGIYVSKHNCLVAVTIAKNRFFLRVTPELDDYLEDDCLDNEIVDTNGLLENPGVYFCEIEIKDTNTKDFYDGWECETELKILSAQEIDLANFYSSEEKI